MRPVAGELTYGLERPPCTCRASTASSTSTSTAATTRAKVTYGDVFLQAEKEYSRTISRFRHRHAVRAVQDGEEAWKYLDAGWTRDNQRSTCWRCRLRPVHQGEPRVQPARRAGVISVTERQSYILRVRELAKACGEAWLATEAGGAAT
jgi:glycyl-tRNA synthetase alpha chain